MKILFSDYDGTIKTFRNNPNIFEKINFNKNIKSISNFISDGNKFILTTGRSTKSILKEIKQYDINFSYLTTYDGRVTFDDELNLMESKTLSKEILLELKKIIENEKLVKKTTIYDEYGIINDFNDVILICLKPKNINELLRLIKEIFKYEKTLSISTNFIHNEIVIGIKSDKVDGAYYLIDKNNWNTNDVYSVGDGKNDLELLNQYKGNRMLFSHNSLLMPIENVTTSVHKLIKRLK